MTICNIQQKHEELTTDLFRRIEPFAALADRYQAFQFFMGEWRQIQTDLEIIQTEGAKAFNQIEIDDETGKENGRLVPFDLVQQELLPDIVADIADKEQRIANIAERYNDLLEAFTPDELEKQFVNEDHTKFVQTEVKKEMKRILDAIVTDDIELLRSFPSKKNEKEQFIKDNPQLPWSEIEPDKNGGYGKTQINKMIAYLQNQYEFEADSYEAKVKEVFSLQQEEKQLGDRLKELRLDLLLRTRDCISTMSLSTATQLIDIKWTVPLCSSLARMPEEVIMLLADKVQNLANKYATTYHDIAARIQSAENRLHNLLGELEADQADSLGLAQFRQTLKS